MTAPRDPQDPQAGYQPVTGYPSGPVQFPATGQFDPAGQPAPYGAAYGGASYDPAGYSPPPYGQPPYGGYGSPHPGSVAPRNGLGTAALVLGIIGVVLSWTVYLGFILGILAIIFGGVGLARAKRGEATNRSAAMAGLVLGIVAIALLVVLVIIGIGLFAAGVSGTR